MFWFVCLIWSLHWSRDPTNSKTFIESRYIKRMEYIYAIRWWLQPLGDMYPIRIGSVPTEIRTLIQEQSWIAHGLDIWLELLECSFSVTTHAKARWPAGLGLVRAGWRCTRSDTGSNGRRPLCPDLAQLRTCSSKINKKTVCNLSE